MPLESSQMLITARIDRGEFALKQVEEIAERLGARPHYTPRMRQHLCARWVTECEYGFRYLEALMFTLGDLFEERYGKPHKSVSLYRALPAVPRRHRRRAKPVPLAVKSYARYPDDPVRTYREFYIQDKGRFAKWYFSEPPPWWSNHDLSNSFALCPYT